MLREAIVADAPQFLFVTGQVGVEGAIKAEFARAHPSLRFAFSRPGFLTFKIPPGNALAEKLELHSVFARSYGYALTKLQGADPEALAAAFWKAAGDRPFHALHVWERDRVEPGRGGFEPGRSKAAAAAGEALVRAAADVRPDFDPAALNRLAGRGQQVLDCIVVEPELWWLGAHRVASRPSRWPGGVLPVTPPEDCVSRAYHKMVEALAWAQWGAQPDDLCVELGSAPGGASQALLETGLEVVGIDPAEMAPVVTAHPRFHHVQARGADLKRREFRKVRWLTADMNVAPDDALATIEAIVTHSQVHVRGILATLKLKDWALAERLPEWLARIRSWGYRHVQARQLGYNRREVCVAALRSREERRRPPPRPARRARPEPLP